MERFRTVVVVALLGLMGGCGENEEESQVPAKGEDREKRVARTRQGNELAAKSKREAVETKFSTRSWKVPADIFELLSEAEAADRAPDPFGDEDPFGDDETWRRWDSVSRPAIDLLRDLGIDFPPGTDAEFSSVRGELIVTNTEASLDRLSEMIADLGPLKMWVLDESLFRREPPRLTAVKHAEKLARERHMRKAKEIIIPVVDFEDTTVEEAFEFLRAQTRELDTLEKVESRKGMAFHIRKPRIQFEEIDDEGGLGAVDPGTARVKELKLRNVPVLIVLQYMCDSSRLRYKVDHRGVTLLPIGSGVEEDLENRRWYLDPAVMARFREAIEPEVRGGEIDPFRSGEEPREEPERPLVDRLKDVGIDFPPKSSVSYREATKSLVMVNTEGNLELVEKLFEGLALEESRERALGK